MRIYTYILIIFLISCPLFTSAAWINFEPQTISQPDGTIIQCFASGDEFYNWLHDENGYTIIQNHEDGYYYYAILDGEMLVPSGYKAGIINPETTGLQPWTNISPDKMKLKREEFYKNQMPSKPQVPGYTSPENIQNEGVLNNLVVYIRFSDQLEYTQDTLFYYNMYNNNSSGYNSMLNYFEFVSYDNISIPSWFYPVPSGPTVISYQDIYPRSYFMPYDPVTNPNGYQSGQNTGREHGLLKRACEYIEDEVPDNLIIDKDNDGYVDNMVFTVRGATTAWSTLLWPHRWALYSENVYINGKRVWDYNLQVEDHLNGQGAGVLCHEMFHSLSAPDLYHYGSAPYTAVGPWDLMDNALNPPESMGAYMKYRYGGWIDEIPEITECGTYTLNPLAEEENNCFKIASPNSSSQYFVLEYRVDEGTFESGIPGTGLLVYRIDHSLSGNGNAQGPPDEVYLYRPDGTNYNNGNLNLAHFGADYGRTEINDNTNPSPFLQNNQPGGLNIGNIGFVGETISFDVFFEKEPVAEFSASEETITTGCEVSFYDESVCEVDSWLWTFEGGTPATSNEQFPEGITWPATGNYTVSLEVANSWGSNVMTKNAFIEVSNDALPEIEFFASDTVVCTETVLSINDFSKVCPDSWLWEISPSTYGFVNGTNENSQHIEIVLMEPVSYSVSLTVGNANGSSTHSKADYLTAGGTDSFFEDFEVDDPFTRGWTVINNDEDNTWELFDASGNGGEKAAGINLFNYLSIFERDQLISPPLDLSGFTEGTLSFEHAYAQSLNTAYSDSLVVKISTDCGVNWTKVLELGEDGSYNFATHEPFDNSFVPAEPEDWCGSGFNASCQVVDITPYVGYPNTQIMFESVRLTGNNMFIDNVGVYNYTSTEDNWVNGKEEFQIFPNPSQGTLNINLQKDHTFSSIQIYNALGIKICRMNIRPGSVYETINLNDQPQGIYFIGLKSGSGITVTKLLLQ